MKLFDVVAIVTDQHFDEHSLAIRSFLESMRLRVDYFRVVQDRNVKDFFADHASRYGYTIIFTHGSGPDEAPSIDFSAVTQENGDYAAADGWSPTVVKLDPAHAASVVGGHGRGTLVTSSCGSGRPALAEALLAEGYDTVIGPSEEYWDANAATLFAITYFYNLLSEDRDYAEPYSAAEAFEVARDVDPRFKFGTHAVASYHRG